MSVVSTQIEHPFTVLIIDDQDSCRLVISALLNRQFQCKIVERNSPEDIVEVLREHKPDLVITDLLMPVMGGRDVLRLIQSMPELNNPPVVAYSATITSMNQPELLEMGFTACISKPIDFPKLKTELAYIIDAMRVAGK